MPKKIDKENYSKGDRQRVPEAGWSSKDWADEAIEFVTPLKSTKWSPAEIFHKELNINANSFVAGVCWAALWFAQECSGGKIRDVTRAICGDSVNPLTLQRFLEHCEHVSQTKGGGK